MSPLALTVLEARVLYTALHTSWIPMTGSAEFREAVRKLGIIGGGFCCRDCTNLGTMSHHLGGLVCKDHAPPRTPLKNFTPPQEK